MKKNMSNLEKLVALTWIAGVLFIPGLIAVVKLLDYIME